jgi:UDP-glucose 4-epimerase
VRALVTGGAGYIGFSVVRALARSPETEKVVVVDNLSRRNYALFVSGSHGPAPVEFRRADILDGVSLETALTGIDTVFHLAAHATTPEADGDSHRFDQVNNWGTAQLARSIEKTDSVETIVHVSSFAVYGHSFETVNEETTPRPVSAYGISKLASEAHMRRLSDRQVHIVRPGNVFGFNPAIRFDAVINSMAFDAWTQRRVRITGDGSQTRPFIAVTTLADSLVHLAQSEIAAGTFDLATHNASVNDIAEILVELAPGLDRIHTDRDVRMQHVSMKLPGALADHLEIPTEPIESSIAALVAALRG